MTGKTTRIAWTEEETEFVTKLYTYNPNIDYISLQMDKSYLQILRKLTSLGIYKKKERIIPAMNKDMLGREISKLLGIKLFTFGNMSRVELVKLLDHLETNIA